MKRGMSLNLKIILVVLAGVILLVVASSFFAWWSQNNLMDSVIEDRLETAYLATEGMLEQQTEQALAVSLALANLPELQEAAAEDDREKAIEQLVPVLETLEDEVGLSVIHFRSPYDTSFVRAHSLENYGDTTGREAILYTADSEQPVSGYEEGEFGMGMRGWAPVFHNEELVGTMETNIDFSEELLSDMRDEVGTELAVYTPENGEYTLLSQTGDLEITPDEELFAEVEAGERVTVQEDHMSYTLFPITSFEDETLAIVGSFADVETYHGMIMDTTTQLIGIIAGLGLLLLIIIYVFMRGVVIKPVANMADFLRNMAESQGDLTRRIEINSNDEVGNLAYWFNSFLERLQGIITQVKNSSDTVSNAAEEIASGNEDLSQRTEEQASSLESSASNAREANNLTDRTLETVKNGEKMTGELKEAMNEITQSSREISEIISKVNDISFQTNLLALNAAVEAARAGEQGRGFAVVAGEVRNLAARSAESAQEIERLINDSVNKVEKGNNLMEETKEVFDNIVTNTQKTNDMVSEIASTLDELSQVTQQNASLVEEIASSSENMSSEAHNLKQIVDIFKLAEDSGIDMFETVGDTNKLLSSG